MAIPALDRLYYERLCTSCSFAFFLFWCTVFHVPGHKSALFPLYIPDFSPGTWNMELKIMKNYRNSKLWEAALVRSSHF